MGRWTQYDEDEYRLPEGMERVGYDADTQRYTFKDQDGGYWEGPEGAEFGELRKVGQEPRSSADIEATAPSRADGYLPVPGSTEARPDRSRQQQRCVASTPSILPDHCCFPSARLPTLSSVSEISSDHVPGAQSTDTN
ncbi:LysM-domain-containing protein [Sanghuangporus baumii]|uniref:LysM-domain-containing protein n=1 Tax=Sanghuangporus baumii TaxID=108892 RepID=A0A9Q5HTJ2_SANBA|nr:LysM-domain-containing protein [Sanghuangporus baumii]